jgi:hypothetical protein
MSAIITEATASSQEIFDVIEKIEPAIDGIRESHVVMALLTMVLAIQKPDLSAEELGNGVKEVSRFVCMLLDSPTDKSKMN